jgi:glycosyltransferase involved in cell wall biosynthesis
MPHQKPKKIALVHDFLLTMGGAERVLTELAALYPTAPIYTLLADEELLKKHFPGRIVKTSFLQSFPAFLRKRHKWLLLFYPVATEALNLRDFDLIISSSGAWTKGIVTRLYTKHIAYIHSPMRYVWDSHEEYLEVLKKKRNIFLRGVLSYLRIWDFEAGQRPEVLVANSRYTQRRIEKYYRREAALIYPPVVAAAATEPRPKRGYFLLVSRLTKIKHVDVVVEALSKLGYPLVVVGEGSERSYLEKIAGDKVQFKGFVSDEELTSLYAGARALLFPSEEDFGLAAAEALAQGTPVIAFEYGGIREIVEPGVTGELFETKSPAIISEAILRFTQNEGKYNQEQMHRKVGEFSREAFHKNIEALAMEQYQQVD